MIEFIFVDVQNLDVSVIRILDLLGDKDSSDEIVEVSARIPVMIYFSGFYRLVINQWLHSSYLRDNSLIG